MRCSTERGQATVEAAFVLPLLFLVLSLAIEPLLLLYGRCVMMGAAAEGCRAMATVTDEESVAASIKGHLRAVPDLSLFHLGGASGWKVQVQTDGVLAQVRISHSVRLLPLTQWVARIAGTRPDGGETVQRVEVQGSSHPSWMGSLEAGPSEWMGAWE